MSQQHFAAPATGTAHADGTDRPASRPEWWRDAVIYQVYPRSFADADGDGMGDLPGIRSRLPYLADLGVDAVWLSPFYASPQADAGYDVADYRAVDPMFGDLHDADALIRDAHALGLRVIVDLVPNHSSDRHEWFRRALRRGARLPAAGALPLPRRARARTANCRPTTGSRSSAARPGPARGPRRHPGDWYLHLFAPEQPDFNWDHPAVRDEFRSVLRFWLDLGVDGFRIDVAHGLVKADGLPDAGAGQLRLLGGEAAAVLRPGRRPRDLPRLAPHPRRVRRATASASPRHGRPAPSGPRSTCAPTNCTRRSTSPTSRPAGTPPNCAGSSTSRWTRCARSAPPPPGCSPTTTSGTSPRPGSAASVGLRRARAATLLMLALPGSAYVYQGEELGLPEVLDLPDEVRQDPCVLQQRRAGRLPRRLPGADPVDRRRSSYGFGSDGGSWLPQPAGWGAAQRRGADRRPGLHPGAVPAPRCACAATTRSWARATRSWLAAPEGVLAFRRGGFVCTVNLTGGAVGLPALPGQDAAGQRPARRRRGAARRHRRVVVRDA